MNSLATSLTSLTPYQPTIAACFVFRRENCRKAIWDFCNRIGPQRLPAGVVEAAVIQEVRTLVRTPEIAVKTIAVRQQAPELNERDVIAALNDFDALWDSL